MLYLVFYLPFSPHQRTKIDIAQKFELKLIHFWKSKFLREKKVITTDRWINDNIKLSIEVWCSDTETNNKWMIKTILPKKKNIYILTLYFLEVDIDFIKIIPSKLKRTLFWTHHHQIRNQLPNKPYWTFGSTTARKYLLGLLNSTIGIGPIFCSHWKYRCFSSRYFGESRFDDILNSIPFYFRCKNISVGLWQIPERFCTHTFLDGRSLSFSLPRFIVSSAIQFSPFYRNKFKNKATKFKQ